MSNSQQLPNLGGGYIGTHPINLSFIPRLIFLINKSCRMVQKQLRAKKAGEVAIKEILILALKGKKKRWQSFTKGTISLERRL